GAGGGGRARATLRAARPPPGPGGDRGGRPPAPPAGGSESPASTSTGNTLSPPRTYISLVRPTSRRRSRSSTQPRSPVRTNPSAVKAARVAAASCQYPLITAAERRDTRPVSPAATGRAAAAGHAQPVPGGGAAPRHAAV